MNILITSVSRDVNLIQAFKEALSKEEGGKVIAADMSFYAAALYFADDYYIVPPTDHPAYIDTMLKLCQYLNIKLLISSRDEDLPILARNNAKFHKIGTTVMIADIQTINICQDKKLFLKFCRDNNFATPKTYFGKETKPDKFPVFIKPRYGKGTLLTGRIDSLDKLEIIKKKIKDLIIQEFIQAPEYTVDLFCDFSSRVISVVPRERIRTFGGESVVGKTVKNSILSQGSIKLAEKLKLVGHNTIQCFLDNDVVKFIEVNPRFGGGAHLGFAAGVSTPLLLIKLLKGATLPSIIGRFEDNLVMLRYTKDIFMKSNKLIEKKFT